MNTGAYTETLTGSLETPAPNRIGSQKFFKENL